MSGFLELFSRYDVLGAFLVNIELTLWSALFSLILGVILVLMPERRDSHTNAAVYRLRPVTASQKKFVVKVSEKLSFSCA